MIIHISNTTANLKQTHRKSMCHLQRAREISSTSTFKLFTKNLERQPKSTTIANNLLRASITMTKCRDNGSPCHNPLELPIKKKAPGVPLIRTKTWAIEMQKKAHFYPFSPKPHLFNMNRKSQLT
jgi:hypothetical protein